MVMWQTELLPPPEEQAQVMPGLKSLFPSSPVPSTAAPLQGSPLMFHAGDGIAFWPHLPRMVFSAAAARPR
jgi:hypothetical protein